MLLEVLGPSLCERASSHDSSAVEFRQALHDSCRTLVFLHSHLIAHNDIHENNILKAQTSAAGFAVKFIDFDAFVQVSWPA